jgi:hypothetical protein
MGTYYRDADHLYEIYGYFMDRILTDEKIGSKMAKAGLIIRFIYTDPDSEITIDLKNPPERPGYYGSYASVPATSRRTSVEAGGGLLPQLLARPGESFAAVTRGRSSRAARSPP